MSLSAILFLVFLLFALSGRRFGAPGIICRVLVLWALAGGIWVGVWAWILGRGKG